MRVQMPEMLHDYPSYLGSTTGQTHALLTRSTVGVVGFARPLRGEAAP